MLSGQVDGIGQVIGTDNGVLRRIPVQEGGNQQIVIPKALRSRLLNFTHHEKLADHPFQNRLYVCLKKSIHWPQRAADVMYTVTRCPPWSINRLQFRKRKNQIRLLPIREPLSSVGRDILVHLPGRKRSEISPGDSGPLHQIISGGAFAQHRCVYSTTVFCRIVKL